MEVWKKIDDYPDYEVSSLGRIKNIQTGKILKQEIKKEGYASIRIFNSARKRKHLNVHALVAEAFLSPKSECVNHKDGNKTNNNVNNLEWCTYSYNNRHAYAHKLKKPYQQRITDTDRDEISQMVREGIPKREIAEMYSVSVSCIYKLIERKQVVV